MLKSVKKCSTVSMGNIEFSWCARGEIMCDNLGNLWAEWLAGNCHGQFNSDRICVDILTRLPL